MNRRFRLMGWFLHNGNTGRKWVKKLIFLTSRTNAEMLQYKTVVKYQISNMYKSPQKQGENKRELWCLPYLRKGTFSWKSVKFPHGYYYMQAAIQVFHESLLAQSCYYIRQSINWKTERQINKWKSRIGGSHKNVPFQVAIKKLAIEATPWFLTYRVKTFEVCVAKKFIFISAAHVIHIVQRLQNPNHQFHCGHRDNSRRENVSEERFGYHFWMLYVYFCNCSTCSKI